MFSGGGWCSSGGCYSLGLADWYSSNISFLIISLISLIHLSLCLTGNPTVLSNMYELNLFQEGSSKVPAKFQQGCKQGSRKVSARFQQGSRKVSARFQQGSSKVPGLFRFFGAYIFVAPLPGPRDWNPTLSLLGNTIVMKHCLTYESAHDTQGPVESSSVGNTVKPVQKPVSPRKLCSFRLCGTSK